MFGRGVFLKGKNCHSIVIVVPLHVSKLFRVLKKLTACYEANVLSCHFLPDAITQFPFSSEYDAI
jgi:hypothetical protein